MSSFFDAATVEGLLSTQSRLAIPVTQATVASTTLSLTASSNSFQIFTGSATGYAVQLPSALTLSNGREFEFYNASTQTIQIKDGSGANLVVLSASSLMRCVLQTNSTTAGAWIFYQTQTNTATGIVSYNVVSSTTFSSAAAVDTLITGMTVTPVAGTYGCWANMEITGTGSGQQNDVTFYNGASAITDSKRSNLSTSGTHIFQASTQTIAQWNGTNTAGLYVNPNGNSLTVGARSMLLIRLGA